MKIKKKETKLKEKVYVESWKSQYEKYEKNPKKILSVKYKANYTILNPLLKQTFEKYFYTNLDQTKFIIEEDIK